MENSLPLLPTRCLWTAKNSAKKIIFFEKGIEKIGIMWYNNLKLGG